MKNILLVEDNPMNMELVAEILESNGMEVTKAVDGPQALDIIKKNLFDLVLLDIQLPGIDGLQVLKIIKEDPALQQIPVVALTAHAMQGDEQHFIEVGCAGYISKPIDVFQFMDQIHHFLKQMEE